MPKTSSVSVARVHATIPNGSKIPRLQFIATAEDPYVPGT